MQGNERVSVPVLETDRFIGWINGGARPCVELANRQLQIITHPSQLVPVVAEAQDRGCRWLLIDGPRPPVREYWILDPWWEDEPEMTLSLQAKTQARRVSLGELGAVIIEDDPTSQGRQL